GRERVLRGEAVGHGRDQHPGLGAQPPADPVAGLQVPQGPAAAVEEDTHRQRAPAAAWREGPAAGLTLRAGHGQLAYLTHRDLLAPVGLDGGEVCLPRLRHGHLVQRADALAQPLVPHGLQVGIERHRSLQRNSTASPVRCEHDRAGPHYGSNVATPTVASSALALADLHGSLSDPLLDTMNFLNEVTARFPEAISFAPGRPPDQPFDAEVVAGYLRAYTRHLAEAGRSPEEIGRTLFQYGRTKGTIHDLVAATIANDDGIEVSPESIVVTVGAQEGMLLVLRALIRDPRDVLLVSSPCYVGITGAARLLGVAVEPVPEHDLAAVRAVAARVRAEGRRPRALYLVPDFANPSGRRLTLAEREHLLALAAEEGLLLLEDNPYGLFGSADEHPPTLKALDSEQRVVYLGSFAKTCFPGARVGYVVADQLVTGAGGDAILLADALAKLKSMTTVNTSPLAQAVIGGMLVASGCRLRVA